MSIRPWAMVGIQVLWAAGCGAGSARSASPTSVTTKALSEDTDAIHITPHGAPKNEVPTQSSPGAVSTAAASAGSSSAPSSTTDASAANAPGLRDQLVAYEQESRTPPAEVERELAHIQAEYLELPALEMLPDFLSVNDVLALLPRDDRESAREELRSQLQNRDGGRVLGAYLDSDARFFMLWVPDSVGLTQVLTIYDAKGAVVERKLVSRGRPLLRDVLPLESTELAARGYSVMEVFIERITTMSVCCLPRSFEVYALTNAGKLRKLLDHPRSHTDVGPGVTWEFLNHFKFEGTRLWVSSVLAPESNAVTAFEYRASVGRYVLVRDNQVHGSKPAPLALPFEH